MYILFGSYLWHKGASWRAYFSSKTRVYVQRRPSDLKHVQFADSNKAIVFSNDRPVIHLFENEELGGGGVHGNVGDENNIKLQKPRNHSPSSSSGPVCLMLEMAPPAEPRAKKIYLHNDIFEGSKQTRFSRS